MQDKSWAPPRSARRAHLFPRRSAVGKLPQARHGLSSLCLAFGLVLVWCWFGVGLVLAWFRPGFGLVSAWFRPGFDLASAWLRPGFGLASALARLSTLSLSQSKPAARIERGRRQAKSKKHPLCPSATTGARAGLGFVLRLCCSSSSSSMFGFPLAFVPACLLGRCSSLSYTTFDFGRSGANFRCGFSTWTHFRAVSCQV